MLEGIRKGITRGAALAAFVGLIGFAPQVWAGVDGSAHDFETATWNSTKQDICGPCHTPHNGDITQSAPLWNHTLSAATYTLYNDDSSSDSFDATDIGQPDGTSKLCLGCHDGSIALDAFGGATPSPGTFMPAGKQVGGSGLLTDEHPISFTYDDALASTDGELELPTTKDSGLGGTIQAEMLVSDKMQCSSCHDPHNTAGVTYLLRKSNTGSALCLTCHIK
jgi:predicted CXXCH cytochrome family protein